MSTEAISNQPSAEVMDWLVRNACFSADTVAIGFQGTNAEKTRVTIRRALEALLANGQITVVPSEEWSPYYSPDPPYRGFEDLMKDMEHEQT